MTNTLKIIRLCGAEIKPYIVDLARLRIKVFHDYPYLYEGDLKYEENYLKIYTDCAESALVLAFDGDTIVGASSALPMQAEADYVKKPFLDANMDIEKIFYFGESVLLKKYRGQGIGKQFFMEREAAAREHNCNIATFCAVERPPNHPHRPADWHPLDEFWQKLGYRKHPELTARFSWKDIGDTQETFKSMTFWLKHL